MQSLIYFILSIVVLATADNQSIDNSFNFEMLQPQNSQIPLQICQNNKTQLFMYKFYNSHPRELLVQFHDNNQNHPNLQQVFYFNIFVYEYPIQKDAETALELKNNSNKMFSDENLVALIQKQKNQSHQIARFNLINEYFYIIYVTCNPNQINSESGNPNQDGYEETDSKYSLLFKFLSDNPTICKNGTYDKQENKCICIKNKFGKLCEYDIQQVSNYFPFEFQIKPFDGKYFQIYKISVEDEIKLEMTIKSSEQPNVYMYRSENSMSYPTQYFYFEKITFNTENTQYIIPANAQDSSIILFMRNPSNQQLYVTLNVKNVTIIDDGNIVFFIIMSLVVTLVVSFLCIFCFNKINNVKFYIFNEKIYSFRFIILSNVIHHLEIHKQR